MISDTENGIGDKNLRNVKQCKALLSGIEPDKLFRALTDVVPHAFAKQKSGGKGIEPF